MTSKCSVISLFENVFVSFRKLKHNSQVKLQMSLLDGMTTKVSGSVDTIGGHVFGASLLSILVIIKLFQKQQHHRSNKQRAKTTNTIRWTPASLAIMAPFQQEKTSGFRSTQTHKYFPSGSFARLQPRYQQTSTQFHNVRPHAQTIPTAAPANCDSAIRKSAEHTHKISANVDKFLQ